MDRNCKSYLAEFIGNPAGMFVDIWRLWAKKTGQKIVFHPASWKSSFEDIKNNKVHIHSGMFRSKYREKWIGFSQPYYEMGAHVFFPVTQKKLSGLFELSGQTIGAVSGAFHETYLLKQYTDIIVIPYKSTQDMVLKIESRACKQSFITDKSELDLLETEINLLKQKPDETHWGFLCQNKY